MMKPHDYDVISDALDETVSKFLSYSKEKLDLYDAQREDEKYEEIMQTLDGMFRCFQNDALMDSESQKALGTDSDGDDDPKANVASVRFYRKVNQDTATITTMVNSVDSPFHFTARTNPNIEGDEGVAKDSASVMGVLNKYYWESNGSAERITDWAAQLSKYGNVPVRMRMNEKRERVYLYDHEKKKGVWKEVVTELFPTWEILPYQSCYGDIWGGPACKQDCIIVLTPVTLRYIQGLRNRKEISQEAYEAFLERKGLLLWDGEWGADHQKEQKKNQDGQDDGPTDTSGLYLLWEVYAHVPIDKAGMWNDAENDHVLHYARLIGNDLSKDGAMLSLQRDFDPDNEIPIEMTWAIPDDTGFLYHMAPGLAVRSIYSVECTIWNHMLDNFGAIADPMLALVSDALEEMPDDLRYRKGQLLKVAQGYNPNEILAEISPANLIESASRVIQLLQGEQQVAGNTNANQQGENFGGRTSATENMFINRLSRQPELVMANYSVKRLLRFVGRKTYRYTQAFMPQNVIEAIANERLDYPVHVSARSDDDAGKYPKGMPVVGMFDIDFSLLDEKQADFVEAQQELNLLAQVGQNPNLMDSETHHIDVGAWMTSIFRRRGIKDVDIIIQPSSGNDARLRQREELRLMMEDGVDVPVGPEDNDQQHIAEINAFLMEWKPVTGIVGSSEFDQLSDSERDTASTAKRVIESLVIPHLEAHKAQSQAKQQSRAQMIQGAQQAAPASPDVVQTPGQQQGNSAAAVIGGAA